MPPPLPARIGRPFSAGAPLASRLSPDLLVDADLPLRFGRYTLVSVLGEGGMARVFAAELVGPEGFRKPAAVKVMRGTMTGRREKLRAALAREARMGGLLHHPNIVDVYDFGEVDGHFFIAMEKVEGIGLETALATAGPLPPHLALDVAAQICSGLEHAHAVRADGVPTGVVHRDLKPSNVMFARAGVVKVMDFGIAKAAGGYDDQTETGLTKGTPAYMSPEQAAGYALDGRSDLFALGALTFEIVTGRRLFNGESAVSILLSVVHVDEMLADDSVLAPADAAVPGLAAVLRRCLRRDPAERCPDAAALEADFRRLQADLPHAGSLRAYVAALAPQVASGPAPGALDLPSPTAAFFAEPKAPSRAELPAGPAPGPTRAMVATPRSGPVVAMAPPAPPGAAAAVDGGGGVEDVPEWPGAASRSPSGVHDSTRVLGGGGDGTFDANDDADRSVDPAVDKTSDASGDGTADLLRRPRTGQRPLALGTLLGLLVVVSIGLLVRRSGETTLDPSKDVLLTAETPATRPEPPAPVPATGTAVVEPATEAPRPARVPTTSASPNPAPAREPARKPAPRDTEVPVTVQEDPTPAPRGGSVMRVESARASLVQRESQEYTLRFEAKAVGPPGLAVSLFFNPVGASWLQREMRETSDGNYAVNVKFSGGKVGKTVWYVEARDRTGRTVSWASRSQPSVIKLR